MFPNESVLRLIGPDWLAINAIVIGDFSTPSTRNIFPSYITWECSSCNIHALYKRKARRQKCTEWIGDKEHHVSQVAGYFPNTCYLSVVLVHSPGSCSRGI